MNPDNQSLSIKELVLHHPENDDYWDILEGESGSSVRTAIQKADQFILNADERNTAITRITNQILEENSISASDELDTLLTNGLIQLNEWRLLNALRLSYSERAKESQAIINEILEKGDSRLQIIIAAKKLASLKANKKASAEDITAIVNSLFGLNMTTLGVASRHSKGDEEHITSIDGDSVKKKPGWKAIMECTENDPEARFLLEYYFSVLDGVKEYEKPGMATETPTVSIVIPVYNMWPLLQNCVQSIIKAKTNISYEIIVGDDCSNDATSEFLAANPWIAHARMQKNGRFILNCNNAAKQCKGEFIYFLNNDTIVLDYWLDKIIETFNRSQAVGIVGSQVLFHSKKIQESGGIIWPNGEAWNYGRNIDAESSFLVNYSREVDYVSGCALTIRANLWEQVGGFSEEYVPAYCEDSDLCFKVRKAGYQVWVQPHSKIIHFEGLSNSKDIKSGLKAYQQINLERLNQKWRGEILLRGLNDHADTIHASNYRLRTHKTVLIVDHYVPQPDKDAGSRTVYAFCKALIELGFNVVFLPENHTAHQPYTSELECLGVLVLYGSYAANNLIEVLTKKLRVIDIILYNRPHITIQFIDVLEKHFPEAKSVYYMHDLHGLREALEKSYKAHGWGANIRLRDEDLMTTVEKDIMSRVNIALSCSEKEVALLTRLIGNVDAICPYEINIDLSNISEEAISGTKTEILFVGGFGHTPNAEGISWFVAHVLPSIEWAKLHIVGSRCPDKLRDGLCKNPNVVFHGFATDSQLEELLRTVSISIAPLPYGAGIKGKVVEALAHGHIVIGTEFAFEGLEEAPNGVCITCTSPSEFKAALETARDLTKEDRLSLKEKASMYVRSKFSIDNIKAKFSELLGASQRENSPDRRIACLATGFPTEDMELMRSSYGVDHDGWVLSNNLLVARLLQKAKMLKIRFYLPDSDNIIYEGSLIVQVTLETEVDKDINYMQQITAGVNEMEIHFNEVNAGSFLVLGLRPKYRIVEPGSVDERDLAMLINSISIHH